jgi:hypothetical protein
MRKMTPLPGTFMITAMLGFLITTVYTVSGRLDPTWGFAFDLVFVIMFIAAVLSITPEPLPKTPVSAKAEIRRIYGKVKTGRAKALKNVKRAKKAVKRKKQKKKKG